MDAPKLLALQDINERFNGSARILEVGFGDGSFVKRLARLGYQVVGAETSEWMVKKAQNDVPEASVFQTDDPSAFPERFDAVCCFEVLEHVENPIELARKFPGTLLYASVPNPNRWYPSLTGRFEYWDRPPNHLWRFCSCPPVDTEFHDSKCIIGEKATLAPLQRATSLKWILSQSGYTQITVRATSVQGQDLLRIIPIRRNSGDYDEMRQTGNMRLILSTARRLLTPMTYPIAGVFNLLGYDGVSYYVNAVRE